MSPARGGRRPGGPDTRGAILVAARELFAEHGLDRTTVRAVATAAGVDPALVHHYFGSKQELYLQATDLPVDPEIIRSRVREVPFAELGGALTEAVLGLWDSPLRSPMLARLRTGISGRRPDEFGDLLTSAAVPVLGDRIRRHEPGLDEAAVLRRCTLAIMQLVGPVATRHLLGLPDATAMTTAELVAECAPAVQCRLEGRPLGGSDT